MAVSRILLLLLIVSLHSSVAIRSHQRLAREVKEILDRMQINGYGGAVNKRLLWRDESPKRKEDESKDDDSVEVTPIDSRLPNQERLERLNFLQRIVW